MGLTSTHLRRNSILSTREIAISAPNQNLRQSTMNEPAAQTSDIVAFPAGNDDFRAARNHCSMAVREFNQTADTADPGKRVELWRNIVDPARVRKDSQSTAGNLTLDATFKNPSIRPAAPFVKPPLIVDYGLRLHVGPSTFINRNFTVLDTPIADIRIGEGCNIGPGVSIYGVSHPLDWRKRVGPPMGTKSAASSYARSVHIGDHVFVGGGVTIMGGVTIGSGAVIDSCSVVTKDIPAGWLARGSPAKLVRKVDTAEADGLVPSIDTLSEALRYGRSANSPSESDLEQVLSFIKAKAEASTAKLERDVKQVSERDDLPVPQSGIGGPQAVGSTRGTLGSRTEGTTFSLAILFFSLIVALVAFLMLLAVDTICTSKEV